MKNLILILWFVTGLCISNNINPQNTVILDANEIEVKKANTHTLFTPTTSAPEYFRFPGNFSASSSIASTLSITSLDSISNVGRLLPENHGCNLYCYDFHPGPLSLDGNRQILQGIDSIKFDKVWKVTDTDINNFLAAYYAGGSTFANYTIPQDILTWPVHGPAGYDQNLSDFHDMNGDGIYNPYQGDYPKIKGTQYLRWIYTDGNTLNNYNMGLEIRASMFACSGNTSDSPLNRSIFVEYEIINRNPYYYNNLRVGLTNRLSIGCPGNENFRSNAQANAIQKYNSNTYYNQCDESPYTPHKNMVQGVGLIDVNNSHNPKLALALLHFKDSEIGDPPTFSSLDLFSAHYLKWLNGNPFTFGNFGKNPNSTLHSNYMFPGNSDPNNWGTNGITAPYVWTYENYNNTQTESLPGLSYDLIVAGPFQLGPHEKIKLAYVFVTTQDSTLNSEQLLDLNAQQIIELRSQYQNNQFACAASVLDNPTFSTNPAKVFPNPTNGIIQIQSSSPLNSIRILNITGTEIMRCTNCKEVNLNSLRPGIYVMEYETNGQKFVEKIVKQ